MAKFEKFFASNALITTLFVLGIIFGVLNVLIKASSAMTEINFLTPALEFGLITCLLVAMFVCIRKREPKSINVLTGALIVAFLVYSFDYMTYYLNLGNIEAAMWGLMETVLIVVLLITHIQLTTLHRSSLAVIRLNEIIGLIITAYEIYMIVINIMTMVADGSNAYVQLSNIARSILKIAVINMITATETRLNGYKLIREKSEAEGTWTKEKQEATKEEYFG